MGTYIHHSLQVVDVDVAHHVRFANTKIRGGKHPHVEEVVVDRNSDGISTLLTRSEAMDSL